MLNTIKAKPTRYKDILFRSRLEAKWAVFFDVLGVQWQYEPEYDDVEFHGFLVAYKPDFYLPDLDLWIEVKPTSLRQLSDGEIRKIVGWAHDYSEILVLSGAPTIPNDSTKPHFIFRYNHKKKEVNRPVANVWWCECPNCGKIDIRIGGGIPASCDTTCYPEIHLDLLDEELPEPEGHRSTRLREACRRANSYFAKRKIAVDQSSPLFSW